MVYDGAGDPVPDAMVEIWQANRAGRYNDPTGARDDLSPDPETFSGFGRSATDAGGEFSFVTVKPGPSPVRRRPPGPHVMVSVFARASLKRLVTRIYFPDEGEANAQDPVLSAIGDPNSGRRSWPTTGETLPCASTSTFKARNQTAFFEL